MMTQQLLIPGFAPMTPGDLHSNVFDTFVCRQISGLTNAELKKYNESLKISLDVYDLGRHRGNHFGFEHLESGELLLLYFDHEQGNMIFTNKVLGNEIPAPHSIYSLLILLKWFFCDWGDDRKNPVRVGG